MRMIKIDKKHKLFNISFFIKQVILNK